MFIMPYYIFKKVTKFNFFLFILATLFYLDASSLLVFHQAIWELIPGKIDYYSHSTALLIILLGYAFLFSSTPYVISFVDFVTYEFLGKITVYADCYHSLFNKNKRSEQEIEERGLIRIERLEVIAAATNNATLYAYAKDCKQEAQKTELAIYFSRILMLSIGFDLFAALHCGHVSLASWIYEDFTAKVSSLSWYVSFPLVTVFLIFLVGFGILFVPFICKNFDNDLVDLSKCPALLKEVK